MERKTKIIYSRNLNSTNYSIASTEESMEIIFKYCKPFFVYIWNLGIFIFCFGFMLGVLYLLTHLIDEIFCDFARIIFELSMMLLSVILLGIVSFLLTARITERTGTAILHETEAEVILNKRKISIPYCVITRISYEKTVGGDFLFLPVGKLIIDFSYGKKLTIHSSKREAWKKKLKYGLLWKIRPSQNVPDVSLKQLCDELQRRTGIPIFYSKIIDESTG